MRGATAVLAAFPRTANNANGMLAIRVATAVVLVPLVVAGIVYLPTTAVALIVALLLALGAWEWARLLGWDNRIARGAYTVLYAVLVAALLTTDSVSGQVTAVAGGLLAVACLCWLAGVYWLRRFPQGWAATLGRPRAGALLGLVWLCAAAVALPAIHAMPQGAGLLLTCFVLVWGADTGAYFVGRTLGRHKLAPAVSPGKTIEGAVGGIVAALVVALIAGLWLGYSGGGLVLFVVLGGWIAVVSVLGDLTLSMFKRHAGIKDSGAFFPGHGGVLDRLDSVLAAAPWFAALMRMAQG